MDLLVWLVLLLDLNYFKPVFIFFPLSLQLPSLAASHSVTSALCAVIHHLTPGSLPPSHSLSCNACSRPAALPPAATDSSRLLRAARITAEGRRYLQVLPVITSCPFSTADTLAALIWPNVGWGFVEKQTVCCSWVGHFLKIQRIKWISIIKPQTKRKCSVFFFYFFNTCFLLPFFQSQVAEAQSSLALLTYSSLFSGTLLLRVGPSRTLETKVTWRSHTEAPSRSLLCCFSKGFWASLSLSCHPGPVFLRRPYQGHKIPGNITPKITQALKSPHQLRWQPSRGIFFKCFLLKLWF